MDDGKTRHPRVLKVARMGHPILFQKAQPVTDLASPELPHIVADMIATVEDIGSYAGLAAPQVHIPYRVILVANLEPAAKEEGALPFQIMVNPVWEPTQNDMVVDWEACFSVPGLMGLVPRYRSIRYSYQTLNGETVTGEKQDFEARVFQHECDHLDGILYVHRIKDLRQFGFVEEVQRFIRRKEEL